MAKQSNFLEKYRLLDFPIQKVYKIMYVKEIFEKHWYEQLTHFVNVPV